LNIATDLVVGSTNFNDFIEAVAAVIHNDIDIQASTTFLLQKEN
jgi:hypothetical protein